MVLGSGLQCRYDKFNIDYEVMDIYFYHIDVKDISVDVNVSFYRTQVSLGSNLQPRPDVRCALDRVVGASKFQIA